MVIPEISNLIMRVRFLSLAPKIMAYIIKIGQKTVFKTNNKKEALKVILDIFRKGHEDVYLYGGRLGSWR